MEPDFGNRLRPGAKSHVHLFLFSKGTGGRIQEHQQVQQRLYILLQGPLHGRSIAVLSRSGPCKYRIISQRNSKQMIIELVDAIAICQNANRSCSLEWYQIEYEAHGANQKHYLHHNSDQHRETRSKNRRSDIP